MYFKNKSITWYFKDYFNIFTLSWIQFHVFPQNENINFYYWKQLHVLWQNRLLSVGFYRTGVDIFFAGKKLMILLFWETHDAHSPRGIFIIIEKRGSTRATPHVNVKWFTRLEVGYFAGGIVRRQAWEWRQKRTLRQCWHFRSFYETSAVCGSGDNGRS